MRGENTFINYLSTRMSKKFIRPFLFSLPPGFVALMAFNPDNSWTEASSDDKFYEHTLKLQYFAH